MQRKNDILMPLKSTASNIFHRKMFSGSRNNFKGTHHSGFAMIMAVIIMLVVATITMFTLLQTGQTVKRTADLYMYEQAELHTKSAIEYALFKIAQDGCYNNLTFTIDTIYDINITMNYVYTSDTNNTANTINCNEFIGGANPTDYIQTAEQNGSVLMDIVVNISATNTGTDPIRYTRRTIQKL